MRTFLILKKRRVLRRSIEGAVTVSALTALFILTALKEKSKIVTTVDVTPFLSYDRVEYADAHPLGILISALILAFFTLLLLADLICTRIYHTRIDGEDIIVYNGLGPIRLLVDGEARDAMFFRGYLETKLKSGVTMVVSPQFFMSYHVTFSDNRPALDL